MNFRKKLKGLADSATRAVQNNPVIKKAVENIAEEVAGRISDSLGEGKSGRGNATRSANRDRKKLTDKNIATRLFTKLPPIPIEVSEAHLNQLAGKSITDDGRIESLRIQCQQDRLTFAGTLCIAVLSLNFSTQVSLQSCELSPTRKVLTFRRLDNIAIGGNGMLASFMAHVVEIVVCGLFGVDIASISLKDITGLSINKDLITADLEAMGVVEAILLGLRGKIRQRIEILPGGRLVKIAVESMLDAAGASLLSKLHLQNVAIVDAGIKAEVLLSSCDSRNPEKPKT